VARLAGALLVVLALTACGKSAQDRYRDDFPPIDRDLAALGADVGAAIKAANSSTNEQLARRFGGYARRLDELRDRLDDLEPPAQLKGEHDRLTRAATETERALADVASAARAGDAAAAGAAATRLVRAGQDLDAARRAIDATARRG
jgi:hypothetical protein